ncbi:MAG: hypothetical protein H8K04_12285 [Nitrospira sp.]
MDNRRPVFHRSAASFLSACVPIKKPLPEKNALPESEAHFMFTAILGVTTAFDARAEAVSGVHQPEVRTMTGSSYEGRSIQLKSCQQDDGAWICEYTILELRPTGLSRSTGQAAGSFSTREQAEAAALEVARGEIDGRGPIREPLH